MLNGQNFLEGLTKGAIIGCCRSDFMEDKSYTKKIRFYMENSEANKLKPGTPVGKRIWITKRTKRKTYI